MTIQFGSLELNYIDGTLKLGGGDVEVEKETNNEHTPVMKHAIARNGECMVEPSDGTALSHTLAEILALHSGTGESDTVVTVNGSIYAYRALVDASMIGELGQLVKLSWRGSNG